MVRAFHILCLNWMQVELRDGVILSGACNRVIPVETVYIHSVVPSSVALAVWEDVDLFHALQSFEPFVVTAFFFFLTDRTVALSLLIWSGLSTSLATKEE